MRMTNGADVNLAGVGLTVAVLIGPGGCRREGGGNAVDGAAAVRVW